MSTPYQGADGNWYDWTTGQQIAAPVEWWQALVGTVITAAVNKNTTGTLQTGQRYHVDAKGNLVADGSVPTGLATAAATNPLLFLGLLAIGGLILLKLVK